MQQSEHFNMNLPEGPDHYNVEDFNSNTRVIDEKMYEFENHTLNKNNPHGVTKTQLGLGNVENKSSAMIRGELTSADVENALGYTAMNIDGSNADPHVTFSGAFTVGSRANGSEVGTNSTAEGVDVTASGQASHAEGLYSIASYEGSHAEGRATWADGTNCHAEGEMSIARMRASHAEGYRVVSEASGSHAEGYSDTSTIKIGNRSASSVPTELHTNAVRPIAALAMGSHAEGYVQKSGKDFYEDVIGAIQASGVGAHAEGCSTALNGISAYAIIASGDGSHAEGYAKNYDVIASGTGSHAEGCATNQGSITASGDGSHAEGGGSTASGDYSHAEGLNSHANGQVSHAEGGDTVANSRCSHAEGSNTYVGTDAFAAHAEGRNTDASREAAHAEGYWTHAFGRYSHVEGYDSTTSGQSSHAEGYGTSASGASSHAEGGSTTASGSTAHSEGCGTRANGDNSHAEGYYTIAGYANQHVGGKYNSNKSTTLFEVGNGTSDSARSNAFEVYADGYISQNDGVDKYKFASVDGHNGYYTADGLFHGFSDGSGGGGSDNYDDLYNKPQINGHTLNGNLSSADLDITGETYEDATQSTHGLMSTSDKIKLDGVEANANNYSHPTESGYKHIPSGGQSGQVLGWSSDGVAQWVSNETYQDATQSTHGLMSTSDKAKLDGIANNANNYSHPTGSGFNHIPTGGRSGQVLGWDSDGTAKWITPSGGGGTGDGMATDGSNADNDIAFPSQTVSFGFDRNEWYNGTVFNLSKPAGENQTVTFTTNGMSAGVHRVMHNFRLFFPLPLSDEYPFPKLKVRINNEDRFLRLFSMEEIDSFQDRVLATFENDTSEQIDLSECDLYYPAYDEYTYDGMTTSYSYGSGFMAAHGTSLGACNMTTDGGFALGYGCAAGEGSVATGSSTVAIMGASHAEGESCFASGPGSHAEGYWTTASGGGHAEGWKTSASGISSHSEGTNTVSSGEGSHSEGADSVAGGNYSHVGGCGALAARANQFVQGGGSNKLNSLFSCNASAAFGFQPDIEYYIENTEITNGQCGCGGCMSQNITMTIHLEPLGMYSLYCSSFESDGSVYGAVYGMITATGNGGSPTWLPVSQTSTDAVQIQMLADDKISIQNTQTGAQFHLIRIM